MCLNSAPTAQEAYAILNRFWSWSHQRRIRSSRHTLRYSFNKLQSKAVSTMILLLLWLYPENTFQTFQSSIYITFIALFAYNPHPITFTISKVYTPWLLLYAELYNHYYLILIIFIPKETSYPLVSLLILFLHSPWQSLIYFYLFEFAFSGCLKHR